MDALEEMDDKAARVEVKLKTTRTRNRKAGSLPPHDARRRYCISRLGFTAIEKIAGLDLDRSL